MTGDDVIGGAEKKYLFLPTARNDLPGDMIPEPEPPVPHGYSFKYPCPCCGEITYPVPREEAIAYICPVCFWENDVFTQRDGEPSDENGGLSFAAARELYRTQGIVRRDLLRYKYKLLLFDLDDTLLRSDKTISTRNLEKLRDIRRAGNMRIGISTSRSEKNAEVFTGELRPDVLITSAGAHVRVGERVIFSAPFTAEEAEEIIRAARDTAGPEVLMDSDTPDTHYRNYPVTEHKFSTGFEECVETDFSNPPPEPLMFCVKLYDAAGAKELRRALPFADVVRFVNSDWYKLTKKGITKASGLKALCGELLLSPKNIIAFGDDLADVEMLRAVGLGVAMGNAVPEAKNAADTVIGDNDSDAIADLLTELFDTE